MSEYIGNRSSSPIVDLMLDTIEDRGYDKDVLDKAVVTWQEGNGEDFFWSQHIGPAIDALERRLGHYGLTLPDTEENK